MFDAIIAFSLRHRVLVIIMTVVLICGGAVAFTRLPIDAVPDITNNQVQILTKAPALSAPEIERFVTIPLELVVKSLPNTVELRSLSRPGLSVVTVVFEDDVDVYFARRLILEKLREVEDQLPPGVERPELGPVSTGLGEIFRYVLRDTTGTYLPMDLRTIQDWIVRRQLAGTEAVAEVNSLGGELQQYHVLVDPQALAGYGLTLREVFTAVTEASGNAGGGYIETGAEQLAVRAVGLATGVEDLQNTVVRTSLTGTPLLIKDIATVTTGPALRFGSASQDGKGEVVTGIVMQLKGANARTTINAVKERIEEIRPSLPPGIVIEPYYDREVLVDSTIRTVAFNLVEGALLVVGVLLLLLVNLRAGFIVASVIPLSMLFAGILMVLTGQSGNLMSLGALDFGIVVDGSLIIVENVLRVLRQRKSDPNQTAGSSIRDLVYTASTEVRRAAQFGEIIILVVYLPIITLQGIEGKLFRPMALTVSFALLGALLLSVTYVPVMCSFLLKRQTVFRESPIILFLHRYYTPLLQRVLRARYAITGVAVLLVITAVIGFTRLGGEFIPRLDEGDIAMHLIRLPSVSLTESQKLATQVEKELMTFDEVRTVVSHTGRAEISTDPMGFELADVFIMLKPRDEWKSGHTKEQLITEMQHRLEHIPGIGTQFLQPIEMRMNELIAGARGDVVIRIFGENYDVLQSAAGKISTILRSTRGAEDVAVEQVSGLPQLIIRPDRAALARYGMTVNELNTIVAVAVGGSTAGEIYEGEKRFDIVVRMAEPARRNVEAIQNLPIATPAGPRIPLSSLAGVTLEEGPVQISREAGSRFTTVQANVRGRDVESFVEEIQPEIAEQIQLPPGYSITYGGQFENLRSASSRLALIVPVALLLILILLYQTFASMRLALMIFVCIPLALIGGVAALFIAGLPFSISAGVGFIALFGIAVLNGIVMIAAIRKHHTSGMPRREAILKGADERLRPVITTAALAGFGFLPMLLAHSAGAEVQRPLATVVIGGLISCTLLTLFLLPILYEWFGTVDDNGGTSTSPDRPVPSPTPSPSLPVIIIVVLSGLLYGSTAMAQEPLTLQKVVERTLAAAPELRQSEALIAQRRGEQEAAWALPATEIFYGKEESSALFIPNSGIASYGIAQSMEFPLVYTTQSRSTALLVQAAQTSQTEVERSLRRRAALAYNEATTARALLTMADSMIAVTRRFYEASTRRREAGEATALETLQASVAVANAEKQQQQAEGNFNAALVVLRSLMAEPPDAPLLITETPELPAISLSSEELERRIAAHPRLQTANFTMAAAQAQQQTEVYRNFPGLSVEYAEQTMNGLSGFQSGKIGLMLPIARWLTGGANKQAQAGVALATTELEGTKRSMLAAARERYVQYTTARDGVTMYQQHILPQAQEAYRIAVRLYEEGDAGYLDVLNAQTQLIGTTMIVLREIQAAGQMAIELDYLLGQ